MGALSGMGAEGEEGTVQGAQQANEVAWAEVRINESTNQRINESTNQRVNESIESIESIESTTPFSLL